MWDMGNVGHDRVACVCMNVSVSVCVVCGRSFWEGNRLTERPFSMIQVEDRFSRFEMLINTYICMLFCDIGTKEDKRGETAPLRFTKSDR